VKQLGLVVRDVIDDVEQSRCARDVPVVEAELPRKMGPHHAVVDALEAPGGGGPVER